jgi:hypothetical protein
MRTYEYGMLPFKTNGESNRAMLMSDRNLSTLWVMRG